MLPALLRAGTDRRGHTILSQDEAWELMVTTGPRLADAGFDVRVPELSTRKATPSLRLFAESKETAVGANQLADVRWSAVFDDVELTAAEIRELAKEARPLIRSGGKWVALDKADLQAAASALAERATTTQLTGADMLRLALGLEGTPLAGGITVEGAAGPPSSSPPPPTCRASRPRSPRASTASCAATRPRRSPGSASSTPPASAAASPSTWASARRPPCSPTCSRRPTAAPRW